MRNQQNRNNRNLLPRRRRISYTPERYTSGSLMNVVFAHSQQAATSDPSSALPIRSVLVEERQGKSKTQFLRAIRIAGAIAKRGWRTLARVRQDGFLPAHIGRAAGSRPRAHTLRVTGICPALRSPRTHGAAVFTVHAATNANQKFNRDRADSSPLPFPIPAGNHTVFTENSVVTHT